MKKYWELLPGLLLLLAAVVMYGFGLVEMRVAALCLGLLGAGFVVLWLLRRFCKKRTLYHLLGGVMAACVCLLAIGMATIAGAGQNDWEAAEQADYAIVLGCKVNGTTPSRTLRERLDLTLELMERNEDVIVIVSGGQGSDEDAAEGDVMAAYLESHGADMDRVIAETESHSTRENLLNSTALIDSPRAKLVVVTSDFHVSRAIWIAGTLDLEVAGIGSRTTPMLVRWCDLVREVFAYGKAFVVAAVS